MKLLDFITVNDFLSYLQSGDSQCKPIYDFYMKWLQQSNKKIEEQTTENFIEDIEQVSNFFEVLNNATSVAVENIQGDKQWKDPYDPETYKDIHVGPIWANSECEIAEGFSMPDSHKPIPHPNKEKN